MANQFGVTKKCYNVSLYSCILNVKTTVNLQITLLTMLTMYSGPTDEITSVYYSL